MKKLPVLLLAGALALGTVSVLASCGPTNPSDPTEPTTSAPASDPSTEPSTSTEGKVAARFTQVRMEGSILVGESVDLAEKITVIYADGTEDHNFTISEGDGYIVNKSVVTFTAFGNYNLEIKAGSNDKMMRYAVTVVSETRKEFDTWFDSIDKNYNFYNLAFDPTSGAAQMVGFGFHHDDDYFGLYLDPESGLDFIFSKLKDGNHYEGVIKDVKDSETFSLEFNPGKLNWSDYVFASGLTQVVTSGHFTSSVDEEGNEVISAPVDTATQFVRYTTCLTYGGLEQGMEFLGFVPGWSDSKAGLFAIDLGDVGYDYWLISDVGTQSNKSVDDYIANGDIPTAIDTTLIDDKLAEMRASKNYTMIATANLYDTNGAKIDKQAFYSDPELANVAEFVAATIDTQQVTYVTEDAVVMTPDGVTPVYGFYQENDVLNVFGYDETGAALSQPIEGELWSHEGIASYLIPTESVGSVDFTAYQEIEAGVHYYESPMGALVVDEATEQPISQDNHFAYALFNTVCEVVSAGNWTLVDTTMGDLYCGMPVYYTDSSYQFLQSISGFLDLTYVVDTVNNIIQISTVIPVAELMAALMKKDISPIGQVQYIWQFGKSGSTVAPDLSAFKA